MVGMYMARARSKAADLITRVFDPLQQELVDSIQGYMKFAGIKDIKRCLGLTCICIHLPTMMPSGGVLNSLKKVPLTEDAGTRRRQIFEVVSFAKDPKGKFLNKKIADYAALWKSDPEAAKQMAKDLRKELDSIVDDPQKLRKLMKAKTTAQNLCIQ
jgi:plasmid stabilization system protein ParE